MKQLREAAPQKPSEEESSGEHPARRSERASGVASPLTFRQRDVLEFIKAQQAHHGWTPSVREIGLALGLRSTSSVQQHLDALERKGYIRRRTGTVRNIEVCRP